MISEIEREKRLNQYFKTIGNENIERDIRSIFPQISEKAKLYVLGIVPGLISFVNWVLDEALKAGKNRLYFLSRDGYQMYIIAQRMVKQRKLNIECRYLNVSRYSMRVSGYYLTPDRTLDEICVGGIDVTCNKILKRGGISDRECQVVIEELGLYERQDDILNYREVGKLRKELEKSKNINRFISAYSRNEYPRCVGYLNQEGLMKDGKYAIVDSGWIGTLQCSIEKIVKSVKPEINVEGYYFGLYEIPKDADERKFHPYYFGPSFGLKNKVLFSNSLFESIVSSEEGMTVGYHLVNDYFSPIKNESKNPNSAAIAENVRALNLLLDEIDDFREWSNLSKATLQSLFSLLMANPTNWELEAFGDNEFSDDVIDGCFKKVAADLTYDQIKNQRLANKLLILSGIRKNTIHESAWLEGSVIRCGHNTESSLRHIRLYKYVMYKRKQMRD